MRIAVCSAHDYDRNGLRAANLDAGHEPCFITAPLSMSAHASNQTFARCDFLRAMQADPIQAELQPSANVMMIGHQGFFTRVAFTTICQTTLTILSANEYHESLINRISDGILSAVK